MFEYVNGVKITDTTTYPLGYTESCVDVNDSPHIDHPFNLQRTVDFGVDGVTGIRPTGPYAGSGYENYCPSIIGLPFGPIDINADPVISQDFTQLMARTNPSRPVVTPLTLIQDLVELPRQLRDVRKLLKKGTKGLTGKEIANQNLGAQFGWLPLIDDATKLIHLQHHIAVRRLELQRLYDKGGLKRRIRLSSSSSESTSSLQFTGSIAAGTCFAVYKKTQRVTKWGTVRWIPDSLPPGDEADIRSIQSIARIVGGLTPEGLFNGAWDLIPWTWITDWFVDVGSYIGSHSNFVPASATHACVMRSIETTTNVSPRPGNPSWLSGPSGTATHDLKSRFVGGAPLAVRIPFVGVRRLSVLASLFVQRFK